MYVREAHPGEKLPPHRSYDQKRQQAVFFRNAEGLRWSVLVDDLHGTVHHAYGLLPNSVFLIDVDGRVSFRGDFSHGPTLRRALEQLFAQDGHGVVPEGEDRMLHPLGPTAYGWGAIQRGGEVSVRDIAVGMPPVAANLWMGDKMRPALDPVARRSRPLPAGVKIALGALGAGAAAVVWRAARKGSERRRGRGSRPRT